MGFFGGGGSPYYISGNGAPVANQPLGTVYTRQDAADLYISSPAYTAKTVVQSAHGAAHNTGGGATLPGAATTGNLLIAIVGWGSDQSAFVNTAAWNILDQSNGGNVGFATSVILWRYAQAGDGTTPPTFFTTAGAQFWGYTLAEINNCTGVIATDIVSHSIAGTNGASVTTANQSTTNPSQLCLILESVWDATANVAIPAGYAVQEQWNDGAANFGAMAIGKQTPASGTNIGNNTINRPAGGNSTVVAAQVIFASTSAAGWTGPLGGGSSALGLVAQATHPFAQLWGTDVTLAVATNGCVAMPVSLAGNMSLDSITFRAGTNGGAASTLEWSLYYDVGTNAAVRVASGTAAWNATGNLTVRGNATGAPVALVPGSYWLVIRNTGAPNILLGIATNSNSANAQIYGGMTKAIVTALGATIDLGTGWTLLADFPQNYVCGRVAGSAGPWA